MNLEGCPMYSKSFFAHNRKTIECSFSIKCNHYIIQSEKPNKKFIELKRLSGEFSYVDKIGDDSMSLYVPVLELETSTFNFP